MNASDLLNDDCWIEIFNKLEPEDLYNVSEVCDLFRYITSEARYGFYEGEWKFDLILPQLIPYLGNCNQVRLTLKPRLVGKSWLKSIDSILEERDLCPELSFGTAEEIDDFLERFRASNPSPIFLRRLNLHGSRAYDYYEEVTSYQQRALEFAQRFGMNVWALKVRKQPPDFLQILHHLPNLKALFVQETGEVMFDRQENGELFNPWLEYALPDLPQLRRFETHDGLDIAIFPCLEKYRPQLEHLLFHEFDDLLRWHLEDYSGFIQYFRALKTFEFTIRIQNASDIFATLQFPNIPLESIKIAVRGNFVEKPFEIDLFFKSLKDLQLLRSLKVQSHNVSFSSSGQLHDYSNPNITHLDITFVTYNSQGQSKMSLHFLPALTQLQHLTLHFRYDKEIQLGLQTSVELRDGIYIKDFFNNSQIRQYHIYERSHSNIWDSVESLRKLSLTLGHGMGKRSLHFSREECEAYRTLRA